MVKQYDDYVFRITDADGTPGLALLEEFRKIDSSEPVIAVTSQLLTTGIDLPSVKNIVIFRRIGSMPLFKQIIGRGTRLCPDVYKGSFDIIDFVEATTVFNDPNFDGPPLKIMDVDTDEQGNLMDATEETSEDDEEVAEPPADYEEQDQGVLASEAGDPDVVSIEDDIADLIMTRGKRIYVDGVEVYVWNEVHYQLESDGQTLRLVEYREFVRDRVRSMRLSPTDLRTQWAVARGRAALRKELEAWDIEPDDLMVKLGHPEADPLDLLINAAWELPLVSRAERALRVRREHREFLESFGPQARAVLDALLDKFSEHGAAELSARALRVPPFTEMGNIRELGKLFGGRDGLHGAIDDLGRRLFDVG
jgi:type I restriction enzyme R subunit